MGAAASLAQAPADLHAPVLSVIAGEVVLAIHSDLSISHLDPITLDPIQAPTTPLPCEITSGTILSDRIVLAWVDRSHRIARIAALPMGGWREGPSREDLRSALNAGRIDLTHPPDAIWSHELTAEPLAVAAVSGDLVFCTLDRGTYRVDPDSEEVWRAPLPEWPTIWPGAPSDVIETLVPGDDVIWAFSDACGFAAISSTDGEVLDIGRLPVSGALGIVRRSGSGEWLITVDDERLLLLDGEFRVLAETSVPRPVVDAIHHAGRWHWTGWRHDGVLSPLPTVHVHDEIGVALLAREDGLWTLRNDGRWHRHAASPASSQSSEAE